MTAQATHLCPIYENESFLQILLTFCFSDLHECSKSGASLVEKPINSRKQA